MGQLQIQLSINHITSQYTNYMIHSFSADNILVPVHYLTFKGVDYQELMDLVALNKSLPTEQKKFVKLDIDEVPHIVYTSLTREFRQQYFLPEPGTLRGELELYFKCSLIDRIGNEPKDSRYQLFTERIVQAYKYAWPSFAEDYFEYTDKLGKVEYYAKKQAVFEACFALHYNYGFQIRQIYQSFLPFAKMFMKRISLDRFYKVMEQIDDIKKTETDRVSSILVHKSLGKIKEDPKFTDDAKEIAFDEYTFRNNKLVDVLATVNDFLREQGCDIITISTLQRYFALPSIKNLVFLKRNAGDIDTSSGFFPFLDRLRCSKRNMQWQMDADKMPVPGHDGTKIIKAKYFLVVDNASADSLGYSYCQAENGASAVEALRMAVRRTGCLPYELLTDNGPAFDNDEFLSVIACLKLCGMRHRFAKLKNANDKSVVEVTFRSIHVIWRTISGYTGHRIVARRRDSRPTSEYLKSAHSSEYVRDRTGLIGLLPEVIERYRNHSFSGKPSTKQTYESLESPIDREVELPQVAKAFWICTEMSVIGNRIVFHYRKREYKFRILETKLGLKVNNTTVLGRFDQNDPTRLLIFEKRKDVFLAELNSHDSICTLEEDMTQYDRDEFTHYTEKSKIMKRDVKNIFDQRKTAVKRVLKRTGFRKKKPKALEDPTAEPALQDFYAANGLLDRQAKSVKEIRVTELDKADVIYPRNNQRNGKSIKIIETYETT